MKRFKYSVEILIELEGNILSGMMLLQQSHK